MAKLMLKHDFFEIAAKGLIHYLDQLFQPYAELVGQPFPITIANTGDEIFLGNMHNSAQTLSKDLYSSIPRMRMSTKGISILNDQMTNPNNVGRIVINNSDDYAETRMHEVRRLSVDWNFATELTFSNITEYLQFIDLLLTVSGEDHTFSFYYLGNVYPASFFIPIDLDGDQNFDMAFDTEKRNRKMDFPITLALQFPAYNIYKSGNLGNLHEGFGLTETMQKLIHKMHIDDASPAGIVSTMEIPL